MYDNRLEPKLSETATVVTDNNFSGVCYYRLTPDPVYGFRFDLGRRTPLFEQLS
jgi:DNA-binding IclR family transcriptional regulator